MSESESMENGATPFKDRYNEIKAQHRAEYVKDGGAERDFEDVWMQSGAADITAQLVEREGSAGASTSSGGNGKGGNGAVDLGGFDLKQMTTADKVRFRREHGDEAFQKLLEKTYPYSTM